ncbi:metal-dependent hydrolase [Brachybacterium endophyticum]|uniref:Metal-dependent hydrolase n=1 Tax=Brachybacterium endophyticum TaxID=2182385 RepID=A0A2U2RLQ7_9MICO|nr:endonuclease/exonuclease/phosphatase family protein [Brachybacterium endophyticum]PWH06802.1 metal-dependent hydrolase [Brachybacterium endophyticum]
MDEGTLRIATYNIHHGADGRGRLDLARTADAIASLEADVVGLQEVDVAFGPRSGGEDQAHRLAQMLRMHVRFAPAIDRPAPHEEGPRRQYGCALLSRSPLGSAQAHLLPGHPGLLPPREPRVLLSTRIAVPPADGPGSAADGGEQGGDELAVLVTHLDHESHAHRTAQVLRILEHAEEITGPAVLVGDLNADPGSSELAPLAAQGWQEAASILSRHVPRTPLLSKLQAAVPFVDAARAATNPAGIPLRRLDSVWVRGDLGIRDLTVPRTLASDHRPVVATIARSDGAEPPAPLR